ncbi:MAG TPA: phytanoyl-CoA dioxygenase family protein [Planctomycetota bacterium]|nr:phytanoyl-CoA dioxygenase family protein [Planctomycetota bacterium]
MSDNVLLNDEQMATFVIHGYLMLKPGFRRGLNQEVLRQLEQNLSMPDQPPIDLENDPAHTVILEKAPALREVLAHPQVDGALESLVGKPYELFVHYCHALPPGHGGFWWHQDDCNVRHNSVRRVMMMYYPHDVSIDMGPTILMPGTHFCNAPTDRLHNYGNIRGQKVLAAEAGTVAIAHYDLWHTVSRNRSGRMRYMVKFGADRANERARRRWNTNPVEGEAMARNRFHHELAGIYSPSDYYKVRHRRMRMWWNLNSDHQPADEQYQGYAGVPRR